jgi:tRNA threonylcarbamoyladenosine biosynthesis protein TsaE
MPGMEWTYHIDEISETADKCWDLVKGYRVLAFHGEMGAGKTTFIHALCDARGVTGAVGSPTFSLVNEYPDPARDGTGRLYHIDLYRIRDEEEAIRAGVEDTIHSGSLCFVEWPERAPALLPDDTVHIYLQLISPETRRIKIEFPGENL